MVASSDSARWYLGSDIEHRFYGVFEGGAAKAVAYSGALQALRERGCWFKSVAGASSGALTAVFVASGLPPERARQYTLDALKFGATPIGAGLHRLYRQAAYLPTDELAAWLEALLIEQVTQLSGRRPAGRVTFDELYDASRIGLNIVAANISTYEQIVFSHHTTGYCSVTDATIASTAIPFVFESRILAMKHASGETHHHTIVDGGVWANFPMFIYSDKVFRRHDKHDPVEIPEDEILGFLVTSEAKEPPEQMQPTKFEERPAELRAYEWSRRKESEPARRGLAYRALAPVTAILKMLIRPFDRTGPVNRGRWPPVESPCANDFVDAVSYSFGAVNPLVIGGVILMVLLASWGLSIGMMLHWAKAVPMLAAALLYFLAALLALLLVPVALLAVVGLVSGSLLLRPARRSLYGLVMTYAAAAGARPWDRERPNIIELLLDPRISSLSYALARELHESAHARSHAITKERLQAILERLSPTR